MWFREYMNGRCKTAALEGYSLSETCELSDAMTDKQAWNGYSLTGYLRPCNIFSALLS